jgi:type III secretion protein C
VEKALAILQNLDLNEGRTKILSLETLQPSYTPPSGSGERGRTPGIPSAGTYPFTPSGAPAGGAVVGPGGRAEGYGPAGQVANPESFPFGGIGTEGRIPPLIPTGFGPGGGPGFGPGGLTTGPGFEPGGLGAEGRPAAALPAPEFGPGGIGAEGRTSAIFDESRNFLPGGIGAASRWARDLPVGHIERTLFFIYKLRYRRGDNIEIALRKIANSLQLMGTANVDLISAINSSQWIESSNALVFTGTAIALEKVRELILEIDIPLRQVFIEMLILDTTIQDSLTYSVDWINRFGGGTTTGEEGFLEAAPGTGVASADNFLAGVQSILPDSVCPSPTTLACPLPVATGLLNSGGFAAGVIGTHLTHNGTRFSSIGALVRAIHTDSKADILLNPKIITEDNNPAEIFVGGTDRYKTQSITNDLGTLVTNNFQFIDVGTTLRVTPLIGNNGIITLEIIQETTHEAATANAPGTANNQDVNLVPVLTKTRTVTKVHVPNGFFVVLSGMLQDNETRSYARIPCLGGIPILGAFGKTQSTNDLKRNLMLFIRPLIIDTDDDYEDITRRQQDVYREKNKFRRSWNYEIDEALNFGNIKPTDPDERNCSERNER